MKLRNLMYATMIACAFASCSKDDVIPGTDPVAEGDASLEIKIESPALTKATVVEGETDATISSLKVYVFNGNTLEKVGNVAGRMGATQSVKATGLTAGEKKVIILANATPSVQEGTTTYDQFLGLEKEFDNELDGSLSMNSQVFDVTIKAGEINYLGYGTTPEAGFPGNYLSEAGNVPVKLFRNVAKIVLKNITLTASTEKYKDAKLTVEEVFVLHASKATKYVGAAAAAWGSTVATNQLYLNGVENTAYDNWKKSIREIAAATQITLKQDTLENGYSAFSDVNHFNESFTNNVLEVGGDKTSTMAKVDSFYVYENTSSVPTLLVVKAKMEYGDVTGPKAESRFYSVAIGKDGVEADKITVGGVERSINNSTLRNVQYNVDLKIAGPGWDTPFGPDPKDNTVLDVKVEVVAFGNVNQETTIE